MPRASELEFKLNYKLNIDENDASFQLFIDCQHPIEYILISSSLRMEILDLD